MISITEITSSGRRTFDSSLRVSQAISYLEAMVHAGKLITYVIVKLL